jgi:capsular polysaccharide biosynthesis protein
MSTAIPDFEVWRREAAARHAEYAAALKANAAAKNLRRADMLRYLPTFVAAGDTARAELVMRALYPHAAHVSPPAIGPSLTLAQWCERHNASYRVLEPAHTVSAARTTDYSRDYTYDAEQIALASLTNAAWVPGWDYVIAADGTVLGDTGYLPITNRNVTRPHVHYADTQAVVYYAPTAQQWIAGDTLFVSGPLEGHFGHWMIDFLPRLRGRDFIDRPVKIAVPATLTSKQRETLALFGVADDDIVRCDDTKMYVFERLHVYRPGCSMPPNPVHAQYVRARLADPAAKPCAGKRLFLTRGHVGTRLIANSDAFADVLAATGFTTVDMAAYSVAEQRTLLRDAEVLMGTFGSNLLALYFAPPGCSVIELVDRPEEDPTIPHSCAFFGLRHQFVICTTAGASAVQRHKKDRDIIVDTDELRRRLADI